LADKWLILGLRRRTGEQESAFWRRLERMGKTATVNCQQCGTPNEVSIPGDTFDEYLQRASFSFACRVCGAHLHDASLTDRPPPLTAQGKTEP
jgi:hypothetical protein